MKLKTNYKEVKNEEKKGVELYFDTIPTLEERNTLKNNGYRWHRVKKCWYRSENYTKKENKTLELKTLKKLNDEEVKELAKKLWGSENMQDYIIKSYDFYKTNDNLIIELQKTNKITIDKTIYYDDETDAPEINENYFIEYNASNIPGRNLKEYLKEREKLEKEGCASGRYDYKGIYFVGVRYNHNYMVKCDFYDYDNNKTHFKRYLTKEEENDYIELQKEREKQYIERLKKYYKRYGKHVQARGYWVNR